MSETQPTPTPEEDKMFEAVVAAQAFVSGLSNLELGIYTIRKAYEMGYRAGRVACKATP